MTKPTLNFTLTLKNIARAIDGQENVLEIGLVMVRLEITLQRFPTIVDFDISEGPVKMMNNRMNFDNLNGKAMVGSALSIPFEDNSFDSIISLGCLHHTGNLECAIEEVYRVLKPGGRCLVMIYSKESLKVSLSGIAFPIQSFFKKVDQEAQLRRSYDAHLDGKEAPETVFSSKQEIHQYFRYFTESKMQLENCNQIPYVPYSISKYIRFTCLKTFKNFMG
ncbi:MAG: class I SAM-dependent methyltransferase [Saprospiraceae bacterium]|nr:class I SAM-dependent methyltransferase [Saprospiraceae bacterium]